MISFLTLKHGILLVIIKKRKAPPTSQEMEIGAGDRRIKGEPGERQKGGRRMRLNCISFEKGFPSSPRIILFL